MVRESPGANTRQHRCPHGPGNGLLLLGQPGQGEGAVDRGSEAGPEQASGPLQFRSALLQLESTGQRGRRQGVADCYQNRPKFRSSEVRTAKAKGCLLYTSDA